MRNRLLTILSAVLILTGMSSCQVYKAYERPEVKVDSLYRDVGAMQQADTTSCLANLSWREVFTDTSLQRLIEEGLANNMDLKTARLRITEAEASLRAAKLSYYPSVAFSPQGCITSFGGNAATNSYSLPVTASWEVGVFGSLLNTKRKAKAAVEQSEAYRQAVQTQLIATIANDYYTLLMLDRQLEISQQTAETWRASVQTMRDMKADGMTNEAAVAQSEANYRSVLANIPDLKRSIHEMENNLCMVLGCSPRIIKRSSLKDISCASSFSIGIPLQLLGNRPDVRQAEANLKMAFYATNIARSAFYPGITIDASAGWTNSAGVAITNPAKFLLSVVGSVVQPIFNKGKNRANLEIAKAQQEESLLAFQQSLLNASAEVSNALFMYSSAKEKTAERTEQIAALNRSVSSTTALFHDGTATYLEVLTAQQDLFSAQLSEVNDRFEQLQATINLYHALGGGSH